MSGLRFEVLATDGASRHGRLVTSRGVVRTPAFMAVGTYAAVKAVTPDELRELGAEMILSNTYHLYLRPGHDTIRELGGLHRFMAWDGPILTDSGGFQVLSLEHRNRVEEEGVHFRSHIDGSSHLLTPELSMEIQAALGSDVAMVLDICPPLPAPREVVEQAVARTTRWARRSIDAYRGPGVPFAIVQGGPHPDLRERSVEELLRLDTPGYAIGGVSVGEAPQAVHATVGHTAALLPADRPRYLMGVGRPEDIVEAVVAGVDLFDCVMPTRNARNGTLFTATGRINIKRTEYRRDPRPVDELCGCSTCARFSRAYLRHLFVTGEALAARLNTIHNLHQYLELMRRLREAIGAGTLATFRDEWFEARDTREARVSAGGELLFVGDAHLDHDDPALGDFVRFLERAGRRSRRIVFLGDLFNLWLGRRELEQPHQTVVVECLVELRRRGVSIGYVEGNRDFRVGGGYRGSALDDSTDGVRIERHGGRHMVVTHGDLANPADRRYRAWRRLSRSKPVWWMFNVLPIRRRLRCAEGLERRLRATNRDFKGAFPEDVVGAYARGLLAQGGDDVVLGHFHVERRLEIGGGDRSRAVWVLPEWTGSRRHLRVGDDGSVAFVDSD